MRYSDNYNLKLPQRGVDRANVDDLDDNFEIIDGALADDRQIGLLMYDSTATYNTGAIRGYENPTTHRVRAYRCLEDNVTGPWDATKWAQTTLAAEIEAGGGGGGSSTLAGLSDVDLGTPADGEVLAYDATEGKWVNAEGGSGGASELSDLDDVSLTTPTEGQILTYDGDEWVNADAPDVDVTKTASGNPIEISDGANAPLVKCVTQITGSQDLHGYDKPWVGGAGKNKLPLVLADIKARNTSGTWNGNAYTRNGVTFTLLTDNGENITGIKATGTATANTAIDLSVADVADNTPVILNGCPSGGGEASYYIGISSLGYHCIGADVSYNNYSNFVIYCFVPSGYAIPTGGITFYPMVRLATESDSTFAPYSNICPITAYTEGKIEVRGKNICSPEYAITDRNGVTHVEHADGTVTLTGTVTGGDYYCYIKVGSNPINLTIGETYTFTIWKDGVKGTGQLFGYVRLDKGSTAGQRILLTNGSATVTIEEGTTLINFYMNAGTGAVATGTYSFQIEKGSVSTDYEPYTSTIHTIDLNGTRYGGTLDVVRGVLRVTHKSVVVNGDSTYTYQYNGAAGGYVLCFVNFGDKAYGLDNFNSDRFYKSQNLAPFTYQGRTNNAGIEFCFPIEIGTTSEDFKTWFASNNTQIVYELATPVEVDLTPTAIRSLLGYSHIESSTGEMEIEYITGKYQPIVDLISESSGGDSQHHYSTDEQVVGTWIDGSTLFEKTIVKTGLVSGNNTINHNISDVGIFVENVSYLLSTNGETNQLPCISTASGWSARVRDFGTTSFVVEVGAQIVQYYQTLVSTVRYTKTSTRSLSKDTTEAEKTSLEPISELLETKTDNLSKDETELKEEDESKEIEEVTEEPEVTEEEPVDPEPSKEEEADER